MFCDLRVTLDIDASVMRLPKLEAARWGCSVSSLVESTLRLMLMPSKEELELPPLPSFTSGGRLVDVADREELYEALKGG